MEWLTAHAFQTIQGKESEATPSPPANYHYYLVNIMKTITTLVIAGLLLVSSPVFAEGVTSSVHEVAQVDETPSSPEEGGSRSSSGSTNKYLLSHIELLKQIISLLEQIKALQGK